MADGSSPADSRRSELWRRLGAVDDPELDESVVEMGFVERAEVGQDGIVEVDFRLPTYWCSPNFAFLMLDGLRQALEALPWSPAYRVRLYDHMFADEVNRGVAAGKSFGQIFGELAADTDLEAVRETFARKAFLRRQEAMLLALRHAGLTDREILAMDLAAYDAAGLEGGAAETRKARYREALLRRWPGRAAQDPVFVAWDGTPIAVDALGAHLAMLRSVRINMEFNGALCRGLKRTRYKELDVADGAPTLVDFLLDRVPAGAAAPSAANPSR